MKQDILDAIRQAQGGVSDRTGELPTELLLSKIQREGADDAAYAAVVEIFESRPNEPEIFWRLLRSFYERLQTKNSALHRRLLAVVQQPSFPNPLAVGQALRFLAQKSFFVTKPELQAQGRVLQSAPLVYADIAAIIGSKDEVAKGIKTAVQNGLADDIPIRITNWYRHHAEWFPTLLDEAILYATHAGIDTRPLVKSRQLLLGQRPPANGRIKRATEQKIEIRATRLMGRSRYTFLPMVDEARAAAA